MSQPVSERLDVTSLTLCLLGNFLLRAAAAAAGTLISLFFASLHSSGTPVRAEVVGLAGMLFYSAELIGSPAFGLWSDLKGRKPFMLMGPLLGGAAVQIIFLAPTLPLVLLARVFQGLSTASSVPSTLSYLSEASGDSERLRGRVMSFFEVATIVGMAAGFAAGGILWDQLGRSAFLIVVAVYAVSAVLLWLIRDRRAVAAQVQGFRQRFAFLRSNSALRLIPAWIAVNAVVGLWFNHLAFQMAKTEESTQMLVGGYTGKQIGLYSAGMSLLFVCGIGLWALAFGRVRPTTIMSIAIGGLFALTGAMSLLNHTPPHEPIRVALLLGLVGLFLLVLSGFTPAALVSLADVAEEYPECRGSLMGMYSVFLGVGQFLGSGLGGPFADWRGVDGMIALTTILGVVATVCVVSLIRAERQRGLSGSPSPLRLPPSSPH